MNLDPELAKQKRRDREAAKVRESRERRAAQRSWTVRALFAAGAVMVVSGIWLLGVGVEAPSSTVSMHRMVVGQTSFLSGIIANVAGLIIRTREPVDPPVA